MKILVACDKFKGSLTAPEACEAIKTGILEASSNADLQIQLLPVADGGDGIANALTVAQSGEWKTCDVQDALGKSVIAGFGLIEERKTAVIEMATASGLAQLSGRDLDPDKANTFGTGELILAAIAEEVEHVILGIGGSATNDAGTGMASALGWKFLDQDGAELSSIPQDLKNLTKVLPPENLAMPKVTVACDVASPLLTKEGCTRVYGPQKGINESDFARHEARLARLVEILSAEDQAAIPGAGAAGGLGFGSLVFLNAELTPGFELVSNLLGIESTLKAADLVITGEGRLDHQSLEGKAPYGVAKLATQHGKDLATFCGISEGVGLDEFFGRIMEIKNPNMSVNENMARGKKHLQVAARQFAEGLGL